MSSDMSKHTLHNITSLYLMIFHIQSGAGHSFPFPSPPVWI